jgi:hypothetical protein
VDVLQSAAWNPIAMMNQKSHQAHGAAKPQGVGS